MNKHRTNALLQLLVLFALAAAVVLTLAWPQLPFAKREGEPVEVCCQFCDKKYRFDAADLLAEFERRQKARREETAGNDEKR